MSRLPRALIFDCDGTLADTMPAHYEAWCEALSPYGLVLTEERFYAWAGVPTRTIAERLAAEAGVALDALAVSRARDERFHAREGAIVPAAPVLAIAAAFRGRGPMAVASGSTRASVARTLAALGVSDWFDALVCAEDVDHPKPAPDVFLTAARRLGVAPAECRGYEDSDIGLAAIRAAGMEAVDVRPLLRAWKAGGAVGDVAGAAAEPAGSGNGRGGSGRRRREDG